MKKLVFVIFLFLLISAISYSQDLEGISLIKLISNSDRDLGIIEFPLVSFKPTKSGISLTYSNDEIFLIVYLNEDETIEIEMEIDGRPFSGYIDSDTPGVTLFDNDSAVCIFIQEQLTVAANTKSVPTAYFLERGSYIYFGTIVLE